MIGTLDSLIDSPRLLLLFLLVMWLCWNSARLSPQARGSGLITKLWARRDAPEESDVEGLRATKRKRVRAETLAAMDCVAVARTSVSVNELIVRNAPGSDLRCRIDWVTWAFLVVPKLAAWPMLFLPSFITRCRADRISTAIAVDQCR